MAALIKSMKALTDAHLEKLMIRGASWSSYRCLQVDQIAIMENLHIHRKKNSLQLRERALVGSRVVSYFKRSENFHLTELRFGFKCTRNFQLT